MRDLYSEIDEEFCLEAIKELVNLDREWVPGAEGTSLYIRPFIIATDPAFRFKPSSSYKFIVILSPVVPIIHRDKPC